MSGTATQPTLAGFQDFITNVMGINSAQLPPDSPVIGIAYSVALSIVNQALLAVPGSIYAFAVYNLAGSNLINFAPDQPGASYFRDLRSNLKINEFVPGVISGTSDQGSATSLLNQDFMKTLTLANLQQLKDPYGRRYLMFAQSYGPTIWGLT